MTLVGGVNCLDGFVISADTEVTIGDLKIKQEKLREFHYPREHPTWRAVIGGAGSQTYIDECIDGVWAQLSEFATEDWTIAEFEEVLKEEVRRTFTVIGSFWEWSDPTRPDFQLIAGFLASNGQTTLWETHGVSVPRVGKYAFIGSGQLVAYHIAENLIGADLNPATPIVHVLLSQIVFEGKMRGAGVGGDTQTWSVKNRLVPTRKFFNSGIDGKGYLWGLEKLLTDATLAALGGDNHVAMTRLKEIETGLQDLITRAKDARDWESAQDYKHQIFERSDTHKKYEMQRVVIAPGRPIE